MLIASAWIELCEKLENKNPSDIKTSPPAKSPINILTMLSIMSKVVKLEIYSWLIPRVLTAHNKPNVAIPIIAKTLADAELDRQIVVKAITPMKDSNVN